MKLPLPSDTQTVLNVNNVIAKTSNLGLLFNKYTSIWSDNWTTEEKHKDKRKDKLKNLKTKFLKDIVNGVEKKSNYFKEGKKIVEFLNKRHFTMIQSLKSSNWHVLSFTATTDSRLIIGLGSTSVIETGMTLHPLYGFPYLPGSGLKGLARAYAEIAEDFQNEATKKELLLNIFGSEDKDPHNVKNNRQGKVFFMDGLPTTFPKLELDIMNPHYGEYYRGEKPPADYLVPVPITFLAVAPGQKFSFAIYSRNAELLEKAKEWLIGGLTDLGAGGKTNVGYGYFKDFEDVIIGKEANRPETPKEIKLDMQSRVKLIKNSQTFEAFLKDIKDNEIESLKVISFKGMESVINIGLVDTLRSADVSDEIKKIVAQKMLEVCKEPDKKRTEKIEKYKRLQAIAGLI